MTNLITEARKLCKKFKIQNQEWWLYTAVSDRRYTMRLIDADRAIINFGFEWDDICPMRDEVVSFLRKQKTIEAAPVVRGEWRVIGMRPVGTRLTHYCSVCEGRGSGDMNYCPNCGCKTEGKL